MTNSTKQLKVVRVRTDKGTRNGLLVSEGRKYLSFIFPGNDKVGLTKYQPDQVKVTELKAPMNTTMSLISAQANKYGMTVDAKRALKGKELPKPEAKVDPVDRDRKANLKKASTRKASSKKDEKPAKRTGLHKQIIEEMHRYLKRHKSLDLADLSREERAELVGHLKEACPGAAPRSYPNIVYRESRSARTEQGLPELAREYRAELNA